MYNLLIGGAAGQGVDTMTAIMERLLKRAGYCVFTIRDVMSRIRGGHNFSLIRFGVGKLPLASHSYLIDGLIALNEETIALHKSKIKSGGFILCDKALALATAQGAEVEGVQMIQIALAEMAKALGNSVVSGSIALGAALKIFGENLDHCGGVLQQSIKKEFVEVNLKAFSAGYDATEARYTHLKGSFANHLLLTGNNAIALGAMAAGLKFFSAYPMSPSTSIMEFLSSRMVESGIVVEQAEDEIAAINMAIGASYAGATAMTATSGGGFCLMVEALGLSGMAEIPLVIANIQRPGPTTGLPTRTEQSDLKFVISAAQGEFPRMVIAMKNQEDCFHQTVRAFQIAEKYQIPVILLSDQYIADSSATVPRIDIKTLPLAGTKLGAPAQHAQSRGGASLEGAKCDGTYLRYQYTESGISPRAFPGSTDCFVTSDSDEHDEHGMITESADVRTRMMDKRMKKLELLATELQEPDFFGVEDFDTLLVGWGSTYGAIVEAIAFLNSSQSAKGGRFGALVFGDVFPLPVEKITAFAKRAKRVINVEQNATGQLAGLIREYAGVEMTRSILKYDGRQITSEELMMRLSEEGKE